MRVAVIGAGFSGLSAACYLAKEGHDVTLLERHDQVGGRARVWRSHGFIFDMGPSWYWMPDIFDEFFGNFGKKVEDFYQLVRLDPSYQVVTKEGSRQDVPATEEAFLAWAESRERGVASKLSRFLVEAKFKYERGMYDYTRRPCNSLFEFLDWRLIKESVRLQMVRSMRSHVDGVVSDALLREILEFPVLFLGAPAARTPAMYSLMNYADIVLGTWYPMGGMHKVVSGIESLARALGVKIQLGADVTSIDVHHVDTKGVGTKGGTARSVTLRDGEVHEADAVVCAADYHHSDTVLLAPEWRTYSPQYWASRTLAPSCILYYLGLSRRIEGIRHHTLVFDQDLDVHSRQIYDTHEWPLNPLFYVCAPSVTDASTAPPGCENIFILVPVSTRLVGSDSDQQRAFYRDYTLERLERYFGVSIRDSILVERSYAHSDFVTDYNALFGNAYGLANTLMQTASLKPRMRSRRVKNLFYCGQLTTPGPGVPPSLISGQVAAQQVMLHCKR